MILDPQARQAPVCADTLELVTVAAENLRQVDGR